MTLHPIHLQPVTPENFHSVIKLQAEEENPTRFVASNLYSLAECSVYPELFPLAIYTGDDVVGFILYEYSTAEGDDGFYWISRFMIDYRHQGKGYGKAAMKAFIEYLKEKPIFTKIGLSYVPENDRARKFYTSLGFMETGEVLHGEIVTEYVPS